MKKLVSIVSLFLLLGFSFAGGAQTLERGRIDLRQWNPQELPLVSLSGDAVFHWQYLPSQDGPNPPRSQYLAIPGAWNKDLDWPAFGYASYHLTLELASLQPLSLRLATVAGSFAVWIQGEKLGECGKVAKDAASTVRAFCSGTVINFQPQSLHPEVVIEIANFVNFVGGIGAPFELALQPAMQVAIKRELSLSLFVLASIVIMGFYHLIVYFTRRSDLSFLAYGLYCLDLVLFLSIYDRSYVLGLLIDLNFNTLARLFNVSFTLSIPLFMNYVFYLFGQPWFRKLTVVTWIYSLGYSLTILLFDPAQWIAFAPFMQTLSGLSLLASLVVCITAILLKRQGSRLFALSLGILVGAAVLDMMTVRGFVSLPQMSPFGVLGFTLGQALLLARRYSLAFKRAESSEAIAKQHAEDLELEKMRVVDLNETLEIKVLDQTRDLRQMMLELQQQKDNLEALQKYINLNVLQRFLPPDLVEDVVAGRATMDDKPRMRIVTILFADLCDFTKSSEAMGAERIAKVLNSFLIEMTDIVFGVGGTIDKFIGDSILVIFGAPKDATPEEQIERASRCAIEMHKSLVRLNEHWRRTEDCTFAMRIGIHHGPAIVGSFGSSKRSDYTAIGPTVNIASRVEGCAAPGQILITPTVKQYLGSGCWQDVGFYKLRGLHAEMQLSQLLLETYPIAKVS